MSTRILIVDDQLPAQMLLRAYLIRLGYDAIVEAPDSLEALRLIMSATQDKRPFAAVLIDRSMPEMNGLEFVRAIRQLKTFVTTPIIVLSEDLDPALWFEALHAGANAHLLKPVTETTLQAALAEATNSAAESAKNQP